MRPSLEHRNKLEQTSDMFLVNLYVKIQRKYYYYKTALQHLRVLSDQTLFHQKSSHQLYY